MASNDDISTSKVCGLLRFCVEADILNRNGVQAFVIL